MKFNQLRAIFMTAAFGTILANMPGCAMLEKNTTGDSGKVYLSNDIRSAMSRVGDKAQNVPSQTANEANATIDDLVNACRVSLLRGDYEQAFAMIQEVLRKDFRNRDAKILHSKILVLQGKRDRARSLLEGLGGASAPESEVANLLGVIAVKDQNPALAMEFFQTAVKKDANDLSSRMNLGIMLLQMNMLEPSEKLFTEILAKKSDHADALIHLGVLRAWQDKLSDADELYTRAEKINGQTPFLQFNMAVLRKRQERYDDALDLMKKYVQNKRSRLSGMDAAIRLMREIREELAVQNAGDTKQADEIVAQLEAIADGGNGKNEPDLVITGVGVFDAH